MLFFSPSRPKTVEYASSEVNRIVRNVMRTNVKSCSRLANFHHPRHADMFLAVGSKMKPVDAVYDWLKAAGITSGPIFRRVRQGDVLTTERLNDKSVALIVKKYAALARLDPSEFAGHSLRAGFVTSALQAGADVFAAADQARHKKLETTREYDRRAKLLDKHAGKAFL